MELQADLHNFGKKVEVVERASGTWFQKPRSVYWEWLFFGKDSPLKPIFSEIGENGDQPLSKYIFNLEVQPVHEWLGYSKKVEETPVEQPTLEHFYGFGVLLAYAYIFGIRDLHRYNLVMTPTHLQVVDVEVVLTKLVLPHETILLPFKDVPLELCGLSRLTSSINSVSEEQISALLSGYVDTFDLAIRKTAQISDVFGKVDQKQPVRIILRNTMVYRNLENTNQNNVDLLESEQHQLERGDIPYFFKFIGSPEVMWISGADGSAKSLLDAGRFKGDVDRHAMNVGKLISPSNALEQRMVQGLFLFQNKLNSHHEYKMKFGSGYQLIHREKVEITGSEARVYCLNPSN